MATQNGPVQALATGLGSFFSWLSNGSANSNAVNAQNQALDQAQGAIQTGADKAMSYQQPYLQNAGADYAKQRGLVQGGYYQTPYDKSYQGQTFNPSGFSFSPSQGQANFTPWQPQGGPASYTPTRLPSQAGYPTTQPGNPVSPMTQQPPMDINAILQKLKDVITQQGLKDGTKWVDPTNGGSKTGSPGGGSPLDTGLMNSGMSTTGGKAIPSNSAAANGLVDISGNKRVVSPSLQDYYNMVSRNPWARGQSGPLEGGMPRGGLF